MDKNILFSQAFKALEDVDDSLFEEFKFIKILSEGYIKRDPKLGTCCSSDGKNWEQCSEEEFLELKDGGYEEVFDDEELLESSNFEDEKSSSTVKIEEEVHQLPSVSDAVQSGLGKAEDAVRKWPKQSPQQDENDSVVLKFFDRLGKSTGETVSDIDKGVEKDLGDSARNFVKRWDKATGDAVSDITGVKESIDSEKDNSSEEDSIVLKGMDKLGKATGDTVKDIDKGVEKDLGRGARDFVKRWDKATGDAVNDITGANKQVREEKLPDEEDSIVLKGMDRFGKSVGDTVADIDKGVEKDLGNGLRDFAKRWDKATGDAVNDITGSNKKVKEEVESDNLIKDEEEMSCEDAYRKLDSLDLDEDSYIYYKQALDEICIGDEESIKNGHGYDSIEKVLADAEFAAETPEGEDDGDEIEEGIIGDTFKGAARGAAGGAAAGAAAGGIATSPLAGVGAGPGAALGATLGAIGGGAAGLVKGIGNAIKKGSEKKAAEKEAGALAESVLINLNDEKEVELANKIIQQEDDQEAVEQITDLDAETEQDLEDKSNVGRIVVKCDTCGEEFFKSEEELADLISDEKNEEGKFIIEKEKLECPFCNNSSGFTVEGKISPISSEEKSEIDASNDEIEKEESELETDTNSDEISANDPSSEEDLGLITEETGKVSLESVKEEIKKLKSEKSEITEEEIDELAKDVLKVAKEEEAEGGFEYENVEEIDLPELFDSATNEPMYSLVRKLFADEEELEECNKGEKLNEDLIVIEASDAKEKLEKIKKHIEEEEDEEIKKELISLMDIYLFQTYKPSDKEDSSLTDEEWEELSEFLKKEKEKLPKEDKKSEEDKKDEKESESSEDIPAPEGVTFDLSDGSGEPEEVTIKDGEIVDDEELEEGLFRSEEEKAQIRKEKEAERAEKRAQKRAIRQEVDDYYSDDGAGADYKKPSRGKHLARGGIGGAAGGAALGAALGSVIPGIGTAIGAAAGAVGGAAGGAIGGNSNYEDELRDKEDPRAKSKEWLGKPIDKMELGLPGLEEGYVGISGVKVKHFLRKEDAIAFMEVINGSGGAAQIGRDTGGLGGVSVYYVEDKSALPSSTSSSASSTSSLKSMTPPLSATSFTVDLDKSKIVESVHFTLTDLRESRFDSLVNQYLTEVYDNVESYKTESGKVDNENNKLILEGNIKFKSGKEEKTKFIFESKSLTDKGTLKLSGLNETFSSNENSFILKGKLIEGCLYSESLEYNYIPANIKLNEGDEASYPRVCGKVSDIKSSNFEKRAKILEARINKVRSNANISDAPGSIAYVLNKNSADFWAHKSDIEVMRQKVIDTLKSGEIEDKEAAQEAIKVLEKAKPNLFLSTLATYLTGIRKEQPKKVDSEIKQEPEVKEEPKQEENN